MSLQGGGWTLEYESQAVIEFIPGLSGVADSPYLKHRVIWDDGTEEVSELLVAGRPYRYTHNYRNPGNYTVQVILINRDGEDNRTTAEGDLNPEGFFPFRYLLQKERRKDLVKYAGPALPSKTVLRSFEALEKAFPESTTTLAAPALRGDTRIVVAVAPQPVSGAVLVITQDGRFITSARVISGDSATLELDTALEDNYDAFSAQVAVRRSDLAGARTTADVPFKPENWNFPRTVDRDLVKASVSLLFGTRPMERVMKPELGCRIHEQVFEQNDFITRQVSRRYLMDTAGYEPRIRTERLDVRSEDDTQTIAAIFKFEGFEDEVFDVELPLTSFFGR